MERKVEIIKAENGFVMTYPEEMDDGVVVKRIEVVECSGVERETLTRLLYWIAESFSTLETMHDKFGKENLNISWDKHGQKVD